MDDARLGSLISAFRAMRRRAGYAAASLAASWTVGAFLVGTLPPPRLAESAALATLVAGLAGLVATLVTSRRRARAELSLSILLPEAEEAVQLGDGELRAALELCEVGPGESAALADAHWNLVVDALGDRGFDRVLPRTHRRWRRRLSAGLVAASLLVGLLALSAALRPERTASAARVWLAPWNALASTPAPPILVEVKARVPRGETVAIRVHARGRAAVELFEQVSGEPARRRTLALDPESGMAEERSAPVRARTRIWAEDENGRTSDVTEVQPLDPILLSSLSIEVRYPGYLERPSETLRRPFPALAIPDGTWLRVRGEANGELGHVTLAPPEGGPGVEFSVDGNALSGDFRPSSSGEWEWRVSAAPGPREVLPPPPLVITLLPDDLPTVRILHPDGDRALGTALQLPLVVDARDDVAVREVELVSWRVSANGSVDSVVIASVSPEQAAPRVVVRPVLDVGERALLPGDMLLYFVRARDGHPAHDYAISDTLRAFRPTLEQLTDQAAAESDSLAVGAARLADAIGELGRRAREAEVRARAVVAESSTEGTTPSRAESGLTFEATEESRAVLEKAEDLETVSEAWLDGLRQLEEIADALLDPSLRAELQKLQERYGRLLDAELFERTEALRESLQDLQPGRLAEALQRLAADSERMREELERSASLLERAAVKQGLRAARNTAEELTRRQAAMAEAAEVDEAWRSGEEELASLAEQLTGEIGELAERLESSLAVDATAEALDSLRAAERAASDAVGEMHRAASPEMSERARSAARSGARRMSDAAEALSSAEGSVNRDWSAEAAAALERARRETLALADEQNDLSRRFEGEKALAPRALLGRQSALRAGLDKLFGSLSEAGRRTALLDRGSAIAAADAARRMDDVLDRMREDASGGTPTHRDGDAIVEALNDLAAHLLASAAAVQAASGGTGAQEALQQLAQAARMQEGVTEESGALMLMSEAGQPVGSQLERLAERQAEVERALREIDEYAGEREVLARPESLAEEAAELARRLESGSLDAETLERQETLFRRLLDAGRSLERRDEDPDRRESRPGRAGPVDVPPPDPSVLSGPRFPHPEEAELRGLPPAYRWMVLEYFDRLNRSDVGAADRP